MLPNDKPSNKQDTQPNTTTLELVDRLGSLGIMAAGIAHEINNPLTYMIGNLRYSLHKLKEKPTADEDVVEALGEVLIGAERIQKLVADLKLFSKASKEPIEVDLQNSLRWSLQMTRQEIKPRARLLSHLQETPKILADETRLSQVFANLLLNAAYAFDDENPKKNEISVTTFTSPQGEAIIEVKDNGRGLQAYERGSERAGTLAISGVAERLEVDQNGRLSVCAQILSSFGGTLEVESEPGKGSLFRITLPPAKTSERSAETSITAPLPQCHILLVDDEPMVQATLQRMLGERPMIVSTESAEEARALCTAGHPFDVILCDLMMEGMTGMDLYEELMKSAPEQAKRMIFITAGAFTMRSIEFLRSIPNAYIEKPFQAEVLQQQIRALFDQVGLIDRG